MNWKSKFSLASFVLIPLIVGLVLWVWLANPFSNTPESDLFLKTAEPPNQKWHVLIPNLDNAKVFVLDRPHEPHELESQDALKKYKRVRQFTIQTNEVGMRHPSIKPKKGFRILCVGESVTFGWGVDVKDSYPSQLSKLLNVEVINAGVPSARVEYSSYWIQNYAESYQPDLILLTGRPDWLHPHAIQDFVNRIQHAQRYIAPVPIGLILPPLSSFDRRDLANAEREVREIKQSLPDLPVLDLSPVFREHRYNKGVRLVIKGNRQQLLSHDGNVLVDAENYPLMPGKPVLDAAIGKAFENDINMKEALMFDGGHPDEEGFLVFATEVAAWIQKNGWSANTPDTKK